LVCDDWLLQDRGAHRCCSPGSRGPTDADSHAYCYSNSDAYCYRYCDAYRYRGCYCYRDCDCDCHCHGHCNVNADRHVDATAHRDTETHSITKVPRFAKTAANASAAPLALLPRCPSETRGFAQKNLFCFCCEHVREITTFISARLTLTPGDSNHVKDNP